ncbi:MAG: serine hydrolase [Gammaproteobacteria bacterium]|nr:serine hydrolase [Gammaproteobacteria bacterium]
MKRLYLIIILQLIVFIPVSSFADGTGTTLRESFDPGLQKGLVTMLGRLHLDQAVREGRLSVALADISELDLPRVASVNGDRMLYAASLPKIAILLGAFVEIERGHMRLDEPTRRSLTDMIRVSSNRDATAMLNRVGKRKLINILRSDRFRLYDPTVNGGLWVGKEYGKSAAYQRDPLHNLSHGATALQTARFYYLLETGNLVGPRLTREMKRMLGNPGIRHKFVKGLADIPGVRIFRKSGSWRHWHADSAIIEQGPYKYILVGLAEDADGGRWLESIARGAHRLVVPGRMAGGLRKVSNRIN